MSINQVSISTPKLTSKNEAKKKQQNFYLPDKVINIIIIEWHQDLDTSISKQKFN